MATACRASGIANHSHPALAGGEVGEEVLGKIRVIEGFFLAT